MGAVKDLAIELEINMADAADFAGRYDDPGLAYRLGMLEACRLIAQEQQRYLSAQTDAAPYRVLYDTWANVFDAVEYLREAAYREP